jgi:hypothetical protein
MMEITDFMLWKLIGLCVAAFVYNFLRALTGRK